MKLRTRSIRRNGVLGSRHVRLPEASCLRSEGNLQCKTENPPVIQRVRDLREVVFADVDAGLGELWVIEEVQRFRPEQQSIVSAETEAAGKTGINVEHTVLAEGVAA